MKEIYEEIIEDNRWGPIHFLFSDVRYHTSKCDCEKHPNKVKEEVEDAKRMMIDFLRYAVNKKYFILLPVKEVVDVEFFNNLILDEQLKYLYDSFPTEYSIFEEGIPEKDIDLVWWLGYCPVYLGWIEEDGSIYEAG